MRGSRMAGAALGATLLAAAALLAVAVPPPGSFRFVILGDRTGETRSGVYEEVWREAAAQEPAFFVSVGDTIQGSDDASAESQWRQIEETLALWKRFPLFLAAGNHDIWSDSSEQLFRKYAGHEPHYSFDYEDAHFTVLDNSRSEQLSAAELAFLDQDLKAHERQRVKFVISHRPSWIFNVMVNNADFALHRIAKKYGAQFVVAGHIHQLLHSDLDGITYLSMPSAGGHFRASGRYEDGWLFGYVIVEVDPKGVKIRVQELRPPFGKGRASALNDWGKAGLVR